MNGTTISEEITSISEDITPGQIVQRTPEAQNKDPESYLEGPRASRKRPMAAEYTAIYGTRKRPDRIRQPTWKTARAEAKAVGTDSDHPTDEQARAGKHQTKWTEARRKATEIWGLHIVNRFRMELFQLIQNVYMLSNGKLMY